MSSRPHLSPYPVVTDGDMSDDITSEVTIIQKLSLVSYSVAFTGTPTGDFTVEVSNDYALSPGGEVANSGTWSTVTLSSATSAAGADGNGFIDIGLISAYAIRLKYTSGSGEGVLNAVINAKVA